jgi:hypothetical protein
MLSVVYMSLASEDFDEPALRQMLEQARLRNDALGVTGLLVHKDGRFMQVLEGPEHSVQNRLDAIMLDPRHTRIRSLVREEIDRRRFEGWSMAYRTATDPSATEPGAAGTDEGSGGFSRFLMSRRASKEAGFDFDSSSAMWLLRWFRDHQLDEASQI